MNWNRIEGNWKITKGKVKEKWGQLRPRCGRTLRDDAVRHVDCLGQAVGAQ
jgi:hypothetical protein